jgi:hypothetical protein
MSGKKKSLKIPKEKSETVNRRRTDKAIGRRKHRQKDKQRTTKHCTEN